VSLEESIIYSHGHQLVMYAARNTVNEYDFVERVKVKEVVIIDPTMLD